MTFLLSSQNVLKYLVEQGLCERKAPDSIQITEKEYKNFNLLVSLNNERYLLVKQERHDAEGKSKGDFDNEWQVNQLFHTFPDLSPMHPLLSEIIHFDPAHSIIVLNYLNDYCDLRDFYAEREDQVFPPAIAAAVGKAVAAIHRSTLTRSDYKTFLAQSRHHPDRLIDRSPSFLRGLERISPGVFGNICAESIEFWRLYQRYESLGQAMAEITEAFEPCCLTHNDLRFNNILLNLGWNLPAEAASSSSPSMIRIIDWEFFRWGDPTYDLAMILCSYLKIWLNSLMMNKSISIETALSLAMTPLERVQPSMVALTQAYFTDFPELLERRPDCLKRVMQFMGVVLIKRLQGKLEQRAAFDNRGICTLQVAKTLLCHPEQSIPVIFGMTAAELTPSQLVLA